MSRAATHPLGRVKELIRRNAYQITTRARRDAQEIGFDEAEVVGCVIGLTPQEFHKTMPSERFPGRMQDVYRPTVSGRELYVKLQLTGSDHEEATVIISFKDR